MGIVYNVKLLVFELNIIIYNMKIQKAYLPQPMGSHTNT